jgi:hypothetical protein
MKSGPAIAASIVAALALIFLLGVGYGQQWARIKGSPWERVSVRSSPVAAARIYEPRDTS